jgi:hypothetical protein
LLLKKIAYAVLLFNVFMDIPSPSFATFDPSVPWTTRETPHFSLHYHQGGEEIARRPAQIAEDVHARLVPRIKWEPKERTHVVLVDATDESNGMSSPIPYNQMILFLTKPMSEPGFGTTEYDDWMRLLITMSTRISYSSTWCMMSQKLSRAFSGEYIFQTCSSRSG